MGKRYQMNKREASITIPSGLMKLTRVERQQIEADKTGNTQAVPSVVQLVQCWSHPFAGSVETPKNTHKKRRRRRRGMAGLVGQTGWVQQDSLAN